MEPIVLEVDRKTEWVDEILGEMTEDGCLMVLEQMMMVLVIDRDHSDHLRPTAPAIDSVVLVRMFVLQQFRSMFIDDQLIGWMYWYRLTPSSSSSNSMVS